MHHQTITNTEGIISEAFSRIPRTMMDDAALIHGYECGSIGSYLKWRSFIREAQSRCTEGSKIARMAEAALTVFGENHPHTVALVGSAGAVQSQWSHLGDVMVLVDRLIHQSRTRLVESAILANLGDYRADGNPDTWPPDVEPAIRVMAAQWWEEQMG